MIENTEWQRIRNERDRATARARELAAENARLRAALEAVAPGWRPEVDCQCQRCLAARGTAAVLR